MLSKKGGKRRVVVATNVAEAGVTIPDVGYVVDSGFIKENEYNPKVGVTSLEVKKHSLAGLKQRRGRAGRLAEGKYYGLYDRETLDERKAYSDPEIQRSGLSNVVLTMKKTGIDDIHNFDFLDHPGAEKIDAAIQNLKILGALDDAGKLTAVGEKMADLPTDPEIGRMLVAAAEYGCAGDVATIAAFLGGRSVFVVPKDKRDEAREAHQKFLDTGSDFISLLNVWNAYDVHRDRCRKDVREEEEREKTKGRKKGKGKRGRGKWEVEDRVWEWAKSNFVHRNVLKEVEEARSDFLSILKGVRIQKGEVQDKDAIGKSIAAGFISNFMVQESWGRRGRVRYTPVYGSDQSDFSIARESSVDFSPDMCIAKERRRVTTKRGGSLDLLSVVQPVDPNWVPEIAPQMVEVYADEVAYDEDTDSVTKQVSRRIKGTSHELPSVTEDTVPPEERAAAFAHYIARDMYGAYAEGNRHNLDIADQYNDLCLRYGGDIEDNEHFSGKFTRSTLENLYNTVFKDSHIYSVKDLKDRNVSFRFSLSDFVPEDVQELIEEENPDSITVDGKGYSVSYDEGSVYGSDGSFHASITINEASDIFSFDALPKLPSGRSVMVCVSGYSERTYNLHALKEKVCEQEVGERWESWRREHSVKELHFDFHDSDFSVPELPEREVYAKNLMTGNDLFAYPAFRRDNWGDYYLEHYRDKERAERAHEQAMTYIEKSAKEAAHQRHLEIVQSGLRKVEEDVALFDKESALGTGEKPWLKYHCPHDLDALREEVRETSEIAYQHAPDAEEKLKDLQRKVVEISAADAEYAEAQEVVDEKARELLVENSKLSIPSNTSLYELLFGYVYIQDVIKNRISFMKYDYDSDGDRYAVAAELLASDSDDNERLVSQVVVRDDGLIRITNYHTDAIPGGEHAIRSPEDGACQMNAVVWTGEALDPDSFAVRDYNIAPETHAGRCF